MAQDLGHYGLGQSRTFTFTFAQNGTATDPNAAVLNVTPPGGTKTAQSLAHVGAGVYTWSPVFTTAGIWTGTAYAPPGSGVESQAFEFIVDPDPNYP